MKVQSWNDFLDGILLRKVSFVITFFVIFLFSYALLAWLDFLPEEPKPTAAENALAQAATVNTALAVPVATTSVALPASTSEPMRIVTPTARLEPHTILIDALDRSVDVLNPTSRTIEDLDAALLYGVVRHPDSATLDQTGTVFLLGHSSYLPGVRNRSFQAFNGVQNLRFGDTIRLQADGFEYTYRVDRVYRAKAQDVTVPIAGPVKRLVLATCNSFGSADDRYIVEAEFVDKKAI